MSEIQQKPWPRKLSKEEQERLHAYWEEKARAIEEHARASGLTVTVSEPSDTTEHVVTFPPRIPKKGRRISKKRDLRAAYINTDYIFDAEGKSLTLHVGETNSDVAKLILDHQAQGAVFITACNPASLPLGDIHNRLAMRALKKDLSRYKTYDGYGESRSGSWEPEPSVFCIGISQYDAENLGKRYGQNAIIWVDGAGKAQLIELVNLDRASKSRRKNPPFKVVELFVDWGYEQASIRLTPSQWRRVLEGNYMVFTKKDYYEGKPSRVTWEFEGGQSLHVYCSPDGGDIFHGRLAAVDLWVS